MPRDSQLPWGGFPVALINRCVRAKVRQNDCSLGVAVAAVLQESGHAELVAALKAARPYIEEGLRGFGDPEREGHVLALINVALKKAGAQ